MILEAARLASLYQSLGARGDATEEARRVVLAYADPGRAYHDVHHVAACLAIFDEPAVRVLAEHPNEVEAALWYHDVVYDTHAQDNEEKSAALAESALTAAGIHGEVAARVAAHVRATKSHDAASADARLVVDIDLSILGETAELFARFEVQIRREYAWVDDERYRVGRAAVLRRFAERRAIYATSLFRDRYESRARENLATSLRALERATFPS